MKLIDLDEVIEFTFNEPTYTDSINDRTDIREFIRSLPVYNVDTVIEQLEAMKTNKGFGGTVQSMCVDATLDNAIEIVRNGGLK